jgi:hypothetical protein
VRMKIYQSLLLYKRGNYVSTPVAKFNCILTPYFSTLWFYPRDFKTKKQFTPALLCDVDSVKYDAKK